MLNNSGHLATVTVSGVNTTALFAPQSGGVILGSSINLQGGATLTQQAGVIVVTKPDLTFDVFSNSNFRVDPSAGLSAIINSVFGTNLRIRDGGVWTLVSGTTTLEGNVRNEGTFSLMGETSVIVTGQNPINPNDINSSYAYLQTGGATFLHSSSLLLTGDQRGVKIAAGILATKSAVTAQGNHDSSANISARDLWITGGDIYIGYGFTHPFFGTLSVTGNVFWDGGTYHPCVRNYANGAVGDSDLWISSGRFEISNGFTARSTPIIVDMEGAEVVQANSGIYYVIIKAGTPSLPPPEGAPVYNKDMWSLIPIEALNDTKIVQYNLLSK